MTKKDLKKYYVKMKEDLLNFFITAYENKFKDYDLTIADLKLNMTELRRT